MLMLSAKVTLLLVRVNSRDCIQDVVSQIKERYQLHAADVFCGCIFYERKEVCFL